MLHTWKMLERVRQILGFVGGGVHKRIDENRELLELLQEQSPQFLQANPWVVGWLKSQDEFLCALEAAVPIQEGLFRGQAMREGIGFPRPWPASTRS